MKYEENQERKDNVAKIAIATAGVIAGGKLLKNSGSMKSISKAFGDVSHTMKKVINDMESVGRKGLTADGISDIFKKRISNDDSTWKMARKSQVSHIDLKSKGAIKDLMSLDNLPERLQEIRIGRYESEIREDIMNNLSKKFKEIKDRDKNFMKDLYTLTDKSLNRQETFFELGKPGEYHAQYKEFIKAAKGTSVEGFEQEVADVVTQALNNSQEIRNRTENLSKETIDEISLKFAESIKEKYKAKDNTGERAATIDDILKAAKEAKVSVDDDVLNFMKDAVEKDADIGKLTVDPKTFRMTADNQFYSISDLRATTEKAFEGFAETIPGKLFGARNFIAESNSPNFLYFGKGTYDPGLAKLQGGKDLLREELLYIGDKFYKVGDKGLEHFKEADGRKLISGKDGSKFGLMDRMAGNSAERPQSNKILNALDLNTKGGEFLGEYKSLLTKFSKDNSESNWERNIVKRFTSYDYYNKSKDNIDNFYNDLKAVSKMYNENTNAINSKSIGKLKEVFSGEAVKILDAMQQEDPLEAYKALGFSNTTNQDLKTLIKKVDKDNSLKSTMTRKSKNKGVIKYDEIVQRELLKEAIFKDISYNNSHGVSGYAVTLSKIDRAGLSGTELNNAKNIMNWGILQEKGSAFSKDVYTPKTAQQKLLSYEMITSTLNGKNSNDQEDMFLKDFKESIIKFGKDATSLLDKEEINKNTRSGYSRNQWMTIKKSTSPLDIINSINDETKGKSTDSNVRSFIKQFVAGRDNMDEVTDMTLLPYHMVNRLMTPLESLGLGFSNASTSSTLKYAANIGLKRILPVAGIAFTAAYLNYESRNLTGTSIQGAYENAKAQFGVGIRTLTSPFDSVLDRQREYNPIAHYLFGDHKDKEEYLDYLENGYDPVRKGRFWSFGSTSEFRGGKISYWEPNKLRQAHSNYRDIAIYGSSEERWKHSIIPTLRHPFSTLRYLSNPYWLEEKHYDDRPYPVSGKMFSEGTPWGAILNPTIGELIKHQKRMHQEHLQGSLLDVRSIIEARNKEIKNRAQENRLVRIDESGLTPMAFTPESMPSMNEAIYSIKVENGQIVSAGFEGQQYAETMTSIDQAAPVQIGTNVAVNDGHLQHGVQRLNATNNYDNKAMASWLSGIASLATSGAIDGGSAISMIKELNNEIKFRSESSQKGEWFERANLHTNVYREHTQKEKQSYLDTMVEFNTKKDFVNDMIYSTKQLSGMYGFLFDQILPASQGYKLEQAGQMSSFTRQFWDESVGGLGGNIMEIARRFFPHDNHDITQINPIRNTQEQWLPVRFQTGDPYTKVTKGEARLPGAGYEALNKLHSDKYGRYGAFDRYKILADIAPLSEEYKIWKKIAKSEVTDPKLKKEMTAIEERVKEQIKEHDFYNYKFIGKSMAEHSVIIEEVSNTGKFKIMGSNQEFTMAGIKVLKDEEGNSQIHNYLKAGMKVNLKFENNKYNNVDSNKRISAIVEVNGTNINREMYESGAAKEKETKETLADDIFKLSDENIIAGHIWEAIGHAQIPFIHNKFLRIDSSLETYKKEQVYGTAYATWNHPIKGFVKPAFQQAWAEGPLKQAIGVGVWIASEHFKESDSLAKPIADVAFAIANPGAFAGGMIGSLPNMKVSSLTRKGARIGATVGLAGYALANTQNPLLSMANFAVLGAAAQEQLKFKGMNHGKAAVVGAVAGLAISGLNPESSIFNLSKKYIPEDTEKKWEIEEYFDRLEYIKYTNLFHKAAKVAKRKEGIDIERIVNQYERNKKKNAKLIEKLEKQKLEAEKMIDEQAKNQLIASLDTQINELLTPIQYLKAGEYTKAALAYKKAADTTIYGLSEDATTSDVLRALPKYDRDFFLDFENIKDPKERKKILQYVSPYKAKALKIMWGEEVKEQESNSEFFSSHNLPNMFWSGWKANVDLDHVKMKTIENEGMLLSDFGMYDSSMNEPAAIAAPEIKEMNKTTDPLALQANLLSLLNGVGFNDVNISVEPSRTPGIQMIANVSRIASYNLNNVVSSTLNNLIL